MPEKKLFPSWRYHRDGRAVIVNDPDEAAALGSDWADTPAAFSGETGAAAPREAVEAADQIPAARPSGDPQQPHQAKKTRK